MVESRTLQTDAGYGIVLFQRCILVKCTEIAAFERQER